MCGQFVQNFCVTTFNRGMIRFCTGEVFRAASIPVNEAVTHVKIHSSTTYDMHATKSLLDPLKILPYRCNSLDPFKIFKLASYKGRPVPFSSFTEGNMSATSSVGCHDKRQVFVRSSSI
jgi:hypothetical protein